MKSRRTPKALLVAALALAAASHSLLAHARGMGTLDLHEEGRKLLLTWVYYYDELPAAALAPGGAPREMKQVLGTLALDSFKVKLGARVIPPSRLVQLIVLEDKTCLALVEYLLPGKGSLEVEAPVLRLLPANYLINVRVLNLSGKSTSTLIDRNSPPMALAAVAGSALGFSQAPENSFWTGFTMEIGTAWLHTNWILLSLLLLLTAGPGRALRGVAGLILARVLLVHLLFSWAPTFPWRLPLYLACLPVVARAWLAATPRGWPLQAVATCAAAVILTSYDLQFLPPSSLPRLLGYDAGFATGLALAFFILLALGLELEKFLRAHGEWRARLCWGVAGVSLWLAVYDLMG